MFELIEAGSNGGRIGEQKGVTFAQYTPTARRRTCGAVTISGDVLDAAGIDREGRVAVYVDRERSLMRLEGAGVGYALLSLSGRSQSRRVVSNRLAVLTHDVAATKVDASTGRGWIQFALPGVCRP